MEEPQNTEDEPTLIDAWEFSKSYAVSTDRKGRPFFRIALRDGLSDVQIMAFATTLKQRFEESHGKNFEIAEHGSAIRIVCVSNKNVRPLNECYSIGAPVMV